MPLLHPYPSLLPVRCLCFSALVLCLGLSVARGQVTKVPLPIRPLAPFTVEPTLTLAASTGWTADQTPADFLEGVGDRVKARWRQMYRESPGAPPTARPVIAYTLGSLLADGFLAMQATDAQQFRNNNQDVLNYCRVLGLGDKVSPRLMSQGKLAEQDLWTDLRQQVVDGHQELCRMLREQRDEDLAVLVDMGIWMRMLDMVSGMVAESPDPSVWGLSVGSPALLKDLRQHFNQLSETTRKQDKVAFIGDIIDYMDHRWVDAPPPTQDLVIKTHERLRDEWVKLK